MIEVKINGVAKWQVNEYTFNDPQMGIRSINMTVKHPSMWVDGVAPDTADFTEAYVEYEGERYDIVNSKPTAEKGINSINYKYNLIFNGQEAELQRRKIRNLATVGVDTFISQGTSFSLYADINQFKQLLENNLKYYFESKWTINLGSTTSESVMVSVNNMSIWDLLLKTFEYYGLRWTITGNTINIGYTPDVIQHVFDYGYSGGLVKITRTAQSEPTINRLIGVGGSRNVPINYFTNRYSDFPVDPNPISGDVNIKNIMPKVFRDSVIAGTLPYIDYVEDAALVAAEGVKEDALEPNEDIYPSIAGVEVAGLGRIDQIIAASVPTANTPDDAGYSPTFDIWVKDIGFDLANNQYTATQDAKISFTSGMLAGYEFVILATNGVRNVVVDTSKSYGGVSSKYKITLINSSEDFTATGRMLPNSVIKAMAGDSFVIYDIIMPQTYVELAELRVQNWLNEQLLIKKVEKPTYAIEPTDTFFEENIAPESDGKTIREKLKSGNKLTVNNTKVTDGAQELHINNITIQYGGLLPKYSFMVTDKVSVQGSAIARLTNEIQKTDNSVQDTDKKIVKLQQYSDRQWKEIQETITLLGAAIDGFSTGINPITVQTMQLLVGNESLQFRFVSSKTTPVAVSHAFSWDDVLKSFTTTSGIIQHMTLGITEISSNHPVSAYKFWDIASYSNNTLVAEKPYYLYAKCSRATSGAVFLLSDVPIGMYDDANYYYFLTGILNSENSDGGRSFVSLYGFTEILPGRITTDKIVSSDGLTYFDLLNGVIGGKIRFASTGGGETSLADWADGTSQDILDTQAAVENLQIGSRNFWLNSERIENIHANLSFSSRNLTGLVEDGAEMTIQFDIDVPVGYDFRIYKSNTSTVVWGTSSLTQVFAKTLTVGKQTIKATFNFDSARPYIVLYKNDATYRLANVTNLMLGLGNKVTWSEAPEDTQARINSAKQEALNAANNVQTNVDNLNTYVTGAFKDGLIDEAEAKAIEKYKNSINESMSKAEASFAKVFANTYLEGTAKTALENAKINLWGQRDTLLSTINTAIADGKTTIAEKNAVDSAFNTFNTLMSAFQSALEEANKAIQAKLDSLSTEKVNNLEIGGVNLLLNSKAYGDVRVNQTTPKTVVQGANLSKLTLGKWYMVSFDAKWVSGSNILHCEFNGSAGGNVTVNTDGSWKRYSLKSKPSATFLYFWNASGIGDIYVRNIKIEEGDKATPWTEAPEDVQARINSAKQEAEQAQLQADGYMRARYVRDWTKGNTSNNLNQWSEIKIFNKAGINIALGKIPETNGVWNPTRPASNITDNNIDSNGATNETTPIVEHYAKIDLGSIIYDIDSIQVWHPYADGRTYFGTKTEISEDGINWTTIFDSAIEGTYKETEEGKIHSQRWAKVMANLNRSKAVTDRFGTQIGGVGFDSALISTVLILLREVNSLINTAGISGIQTDQTTGLKNMPSYWSGGSYEQAITFVPFIKALQEGTAIDLDDYNNLPKIVFLHSGAGKLGDFIVEESGRVVMIDPATGAVRLTFNTENIGAIKDVDQSDGGSTNIGSGVAYYQKLILPGSVTVTKNGSTGFHAGGEISITASGRKQASGAPSEAEVVLYMYRDGAKYASLGHSHLYFEGDTNETKTGYGTISPRAFSGLPTGIYTFGLENTFVGDISNPSSSSSASSFSWNYTVAGARHFGFGLDGLLAYFANNHLYFTENGGLDVRGKTNLPGVLLSATVLIAGGWMAVWGAKASLVSPVTPTPVRNSTGRYTVSHDVGHTNYQIYASSHTANTTSHIVSKSANSFTIEWRTVASSPVLVNTTFDFQLVGNNYA